MNSHILEKSKGIVPKYLTGKYQLIATVTFTALFSIVFILINVPYSHNFWFELNDSSAFAFTVLFFIIALLLVILSKRVMYTTCKAVDINYLQYVLWNLAEVVLISLLYTSFSVLGEDIEELSLSLHGKSAMRIFGSAMVYCVPSIIFPYIIAGMYFAIDDKNKFIKLMNFTTMENVKGKDAVSEQKITLFDNSGVLKLSVDLRNLYYIESDDNYINVWYSDNKGSLTSYMLRCRLRTVEESFKDSPLMRCHRKYIVNMDKVKVLRKEKDGYVLVLDNDRIPPIAVTKTYTENILSRYNAK